MSNIRPTASFSVGGTDLTLLSRPDDPVVWIKTRRTISLPLWQHQITIAGRIQPPNLTYREDLQHFRLEAPGAVSLAWYLDQRGPLPMADFMPVALGLLNLLDQWHRRGVAVLSLTPRHLLVRPDSHEYWLADWSLAIPYADSSFDALGNYFTDEVAPYASPEQTGKTDLPLDYRSDYFSLGVLLYRVVTGHLPFDGTDTASLVYRILTYEPEPSHTLNPTVSPGFSAILTKLIAKNPADRYQSIDGIRHDLARISEPDFEPMTFRPGETDSRPEFVTRPLIVGRQMILDNISRLIQTASDRQQKGVALLVGASGSGKTVLLHELETRLFDKHYVLFSDLYDDQTHPYSGLQAAINTLADRLLGQSLAVQDDFRFHLQAQIGNVLSVLTDFGPGLLKIVGAVSSTQSELTGSANQDRLAYVLAGFIRALVLTGRPVLWLIDNLHSASDATLRLLNSLSREALLTQLTLVAATNRTTADSYASNERIHAFVEQVEAFSDSVTAVELVPNLNHSELAEWLQTLSVNPDTIDEVATSIHQKTGGNPFAVQQLLEQLIKQNAVIKPVGAYFFQLDTAVLATYQAADSLLDYLTAQIEKLVPAARHLFDLAACFRQPFRADELATLANVPLHQVEEAFETLLLVGIIVPQSDIDSAGLTYRFSNPQLVDSGRGLLPAADRQAAFSKAASYLLAHDNLDSTSNLFQLVTTVLELPPHQTGPYSDYLWRAAQKAVAIGVIDLGLRCYARVTEQFSETDWQAQFAHCFAIYQEYLLAVAYAENKQDLLDELASFMATKARHREDMAQMQHTYGLGLIHQQRNEEVIQTTLPILHQFGVDIALEPDQLGIIAYSIRASLLLRNKTPEQIESLPDTTDPNARLVINMLGNVSQAAALVRPKMIPQLMYHDLRQSIQYGLTAESGAGFLMYALVQTAFQGNYQTGADMMELALRLSYRFGSVTIEQSCQLVKSIYIHHWVAPYQDSLDILLDTYHRSRESGLLTNAVNALGVASLMSIFSQLPLEGVFQRSADALKLVRTQSHSLPQYSCRMALQIVHDLQQPQAPDSFMMGEYADVSELEPYLRQENQVAILTMLLTIKLYWAVHVHKPGMEGVFDEFRKLMKTTGEGSFQTSPGYFYGAMLCLQQPGPISKKHKQTIRLALSRLKAFSKVYQGNSLSRYQLLNGYYQLRIGNTSAGLVMLDRAIETASQYGQLVEQALAHEVKARHYLSLNQLALSRLELTEAISLYGTWGAWAIVGRIRAEFPYMADGTNRPTETDPLADANTAGSLGQIDLLSFLKNSATISSQLKLEDLLTNLLGVVLENAGAQKGALLLNKNTDLRVFAVKEQNKPVSLEMQELAQANLPQNPIRYATRTARPLVLTQAYTDRIFAADAYFQRNHTLSVLVLPVLKNEQPLAVIYLENNSTPGAFNSRRLEVLQLLSVQIAISLENALLYDDMEERVQERTLQLRQEMDTSEALLLNILPKAVADELKHTGRAAARQFDNVTVLFTDFVNFTRIAEQMEPEALVAELDFCFGEFDRITDSYGLEKIKTIGDAYLCAGGLSGSKPNHTADVVRAALSIRQFIADRKQQREAEGKPFFEIRIGVHNGPLVAGVVGTRKFAYDIWGDTVNTAARMEQSSEPGRVNVSGRAWAAIEGQFTGQYRGQVKAKNKGAIDMYFVDSVLEPLG